MSLAHQYFDAYITSVSLENDLADAVLEAAHIDPNYFPRVCEDVTFDYYDSSFELKQTLVGWLPPDGTLEAWKRLGFSRFWICYTDGTEIYGDLLNEPKLGKLTHT